MAQHDMVIAHLTESAASRLLDSRPSGFNRSCTRATVRHFLVVLRDLGVAGPSPRAHADRSSASRLQHDYITYLRQERALAPRMLRQRPRRCRPHIYTGQEVRALLRATARVKPNKGLRAPTYVTLFGLIAVTGMRISGAIALDVRDVDLGGGVITIRRTKFGKSRLVPIRPTTRDRLRAYSRRRDRLLGFVPVAFFVSDTGRRVVARPRPRGASLRSLCARS